ncbi:hypothetical protein LCGC14_1646060 [marine sediment metagenome]|uniref:Uncharacterized protein n=1 Tax=marine sediment metagenome TaxID=412755 RepID=A0A0F9IKP7_9ZZZZ
MNKNDLQSLSNEKKITIACDPNTSPETLTALSVKDPNGDCHSWYVRCAVAENPNTPVEVLTKMASTNNPDWDEDIAWAVKENPNTPKKVVDEIIRFFDEDF